MMNSRSGPVITLANRSICLTLRSGSGILLEAALPKGALRQGLTPPVVELEGRTRTLVPTALAPRGRGRRLPNGATEHVVAGPVKGCPDLELEIVLRIPRVSPVVRFQYRLRTVGRSYTLTKAQGTDQLAYFSAALPARADCTEVQLSDFDYSNHFYVPHEKWFE